MKFEKDKLIQTITSDKKPVLYIDKIVLLTNDKNWVNRLFGSMLMLEFACIDDKGEKRQSSSEPLSFSTYITPYHRQPVLEVNGLFSLSERLENRGEKDCKNWRITLELKHLDFLEGESLEVITSKSPYSFITPNDVIREIEKWKAMFGNLSSSTASLLRYVRNIRLDWSQIDEDFSDEFNIGVTKSIILSGLTHSHQTIKSNSLLFENSKIAQLLVNTFLVEKKLTTSLLKEIHQQVIKNGGQFRTQDIVVSDKNKIINPQFTKASEVAKQMEVLVSWYNLEIEKKELHPLILSTLFHHNLVKIHPFLDGNGRLARVVTSLILLSFNIPPPIIKSEDRVEYIKSLRDADNGDIKPLIVFIGNRIIQSMNYAVILKHNSDD